MKKTLILIFVFFSCANLYAQYTTYAKAKLKCDPEHCYQRGKKRFDKGHYNSAVYPLRKAVANEHSDAKCVLGICYEEGKGTRRNLYNARQLYFVAHDEGSNEATDRLFAMGRKSENNGFPEYAIKIYSHICDRSAEAVDRLSLLTSDIAAFDKGVKANFYKAVYEVGNIYMRRNDYSKALQMFYRAADTDPSAYVKCGEIHERARHYKTAVSCYELAAKGGSAVGAYKAGMMYITGGEGSYEQETNRKMLEAMENKLGLIGAIVGAARQRVESGDGKYELGPVDKDPGKAFYYLNKFAQLAGDNYSDDTKEGWYYLGNCYYNGLTTSIDWKKALLYFERAEHTYGSMSDNAATEMYKMIGDCYYFGKYGATKNIKKAYDAYYNAVNRYTKAVDRANQRNSQESSLSQIVIFLMKNYGDVENTRLDMVASEACCRISQCIINDRSLGDASTAFAFCSNAKKRYEQLPIAHYLIAQCYELGVGTAKDVLAAYKSYQTVIDMSGLSDKHLGTGLERTLRTNEMEECKIASRTAIQRLIPDMKATGDLLYSRGNLDAAREYYELPDIRTYNAAKCYEAYADNQLEAAQRALVMYYNELKNATIYYYKARSIFYEIGDVAMAEKMTDRVENGVMAEQRRRDEMARRARESTENESAARSADGKLSEMSASELESYCSDHQGKMVTFKWSTSVGGVATRYYNVIGYIDGRYEKNLLSSDVINVKATSITLTGRSGNADAASDAEIVEKVKDLCEGKRYGYLMSEVENLSAE